MPIYEYKCGVCAHRFEAIQKFSDPPLDQCPKCGGPATKMQSAPAFQFKGTGWYVTDYPKKGQESESRGDGGAKDTAAGGEKTEKAEKTERTEKTEKTEKADKAEKAEKSEQSAKADKGEKTEPKAGKGVDKPAATKSEGPPTRSDR